MNERIKIANGGDIVIYAPKGEGSLLLECCGDGIILHLNSHCNHLDREALSDASAVPYVGKRMRYVRADGAWEIVTLICISDSMCESWYTEREGGAHLTTNALDALTPDPPKPKYRAYATPEEACCLIGKLVEDVAGNQYEVRTVSKIGVEYASDKGWDMFEGLFKHYKCVDTGEPCGIPVN